MNKIPHTVIDECASVEENLRGVADQQELQGRVRVSAVLNMGASALRMLLAAVRGAQEGQPEQAPQPEAPKADGPSGG